jgi:5-methylcytosine-specific restriction endonuclease McrA
MPWKPADRNPAYNKASWKRARLACLRDARWHCQIKGPGCIGAASIADHIFGIGNDPDHRHLQAACRPCSDAKTHRESGDARRGSGSSATDPEPQPRTAW